LSRLDLINKLCEAAKIKRAKKDRQFLTKREIIHLLGYLEAEEKS